MKKMNKKGFTLVEMLVVIAIIAVLVSIVIPTVTDSTEKAREAADAANIRGKIAEVTMQAMTTGEEKSATYTITQNGDWDYVKDAGGETLTGTKGQILTITSDEDGNVSLSAANAPAGEGEGEGEGA